MTAPLDSLTVLTTKGPLATKRITAVQGGSPKIENYGKAQRFSFDEWPVSSFDEMAAALEALLERQQSFVVRGKPIDGIDRRDAPRRLRPRGDQPATLLPQARRWLALDMDSVPCPAGIDPIWEPDRVVEYVVELLPEEFHGCSVFWAFTSGHRFKPGIRIRLWFWLDRSLEDWEIKAWLAAPIAEQLIDGALYSPAQPIYVAQPVFVGMNDPLPYRYGTWRGHSDAVTPPVIEKSQRGAHSPSGTNRGDDRGYAAHRSRLGDGEGRSGFYGPLKAATGAFIGEAGADADTAWLRADLEQAIREAPRDPARHDDAYVEARVADLDSWIAWTRDRQREKEAANGTAEICDPTYPALLGSVAEARGVLAETMRDIVNQVHAHRAGLAGLQEGVEPPPPPAWAINVDVGLGKTRAFREIVVPKLVRDGLSVVMAVPRHKLGDEFVRDLVKAGITARVFRGRDAEDPDAPGEKMCREHERAAAIVQAMGDVTKHACGKGERRCEFYDVCGYRQQAAAKPDVWVVPHELLFHPQPKFIPALAVLAIEESFWDAGLEGTDAPIVLPLAWLAQARQVPGSATGTVFLAEVSGLIHDAVARQAGTLKIGALRRGGLSADDLRQCQKLEWQRKIDIDDVLPGMPRLDAIRLCTQAAEHNRRVVRLARFWDLLARQFESGLDQSPWVERTEERGEPCVRMAWRRDIHKSWSAPTIIMDATLQPEIVRQFFPQIGESIRVAAPMPHTYVRQITDKPMSLASLLKTETASEHRNQSRRNNVERVRRYIEVRAADVWPGEALVICQERVEVALKAGDLPDNVDVTHFNAITGLNTWSDVAALIVIGRTEPSPRSVERIARALFGSAVVGVVPDDKGNMYPRVARGIRMRDGTGRKVEGNQHPDPRAEAVRRAICEAELVQAIGRGRGVNRGPNNPLQIDILTNVVLPIEVDEITTWSAIQPSAEDVMRARGAVPRTHADMAACYPDLFRSAEAARERGGGGNSGKTSIGIPYRRNTRVFGEALYRRPGSRGPAGRLLYDPARIDPATWLAGRLGTVLSTGHVADR